MVADKYMKMNGYFFLKNHKFPHGSNKWRTTNEIKFSTLMNNVLIQWSNIPSQMCIWCIDLEFTTSFVIFINDVVMH